MCRKVCIWNSFMSWSWLQTNFYVTEATQFCNTAGLQTILSHLYSSELYVDHNWLKSLLWMIPSKSCSAKCKSLACCCKTSKEGLLKVRKNRDDFMKTSLLPKSKEIILRIYVLLYNTWNTFIGFWEKRCLHKIISIFTDL